MAWPGRFKFFQKHDDYEEAVQACKLARSEMEEAVVELNRQHELGIELIEDAADLIGSIAHRPKNLDSNGRAAMKVEVKFIYFQDFAARERREALTSTAIAGFGVAAGSAVKHLVPRAAMWAARTFGTASTGTAISALSGAAMESASLAWIGGGALSAGGGGMAAGNARLALAGPIGNGITVITLTTSGVRLFKKYQEIQKEKKEALVPIEQYTNRTKKDKTDINDLITRTRRLRNALTDIYEQCTHLRGTVFTDLDDTARRRLAVLVHQTSSLTLLLHSNAREQELAARLFEDDRTLDAQLESEWRQHLDRLKADMEVFLSLVVEMSSTDAVAACEASVALARRLGLPSEDILDTPEKVRAYFMD